MDLLSWCSSAGTIAAKFLNTLKPTYNALTERAMIVLQERAHSLPDPQALTTSRGGMDKSIWPVAKQVLKLLEDPFSAVNEENAWKTPMDAPGSVPAVTWGFDPHAQRANTWWDSRSPLSTRLGVT